MHSFIFTKISNLISFKKQLAEDLYCFLRALLNWKSSVLFFHQLVDLMIISTNISLIPKEKYFIIFLQILQTVCLIPANGKYIKAYLSSNRILKSIIWEFALERFNKILSNFDFSIIGFKLISFFLRAIPSDRWHVDQTGSILNKSTSFYWNI